MKKQVLRLSLTGVAIMATAAPGHAAPRTAWDASRTPDDTDIVTTGVAKGRDRLDSATSTSAIKESKIETLGARSLADLFRNIPGIRAEPGAGEGNGSYTVRGLPLVYSGAKYVQIQEDGLPVLEFGDFLSMTPDLFLRADQNLAQVEAIRGGSASTFASNAPGGVINLISKTGEVEGGSIAATAGVDYDSQRWDFDYGSKLSDTLSFHVGGFYRQGEGPRSTGFDTYRGGQVKLNITKRFDGGYVRVYAKLLDDRVPFYQPYPMLIEGTDANPSYSDVPNFSATKDTTLSRNISVAPGVDANNNVASWDAQKGQHPVAKSIGLEAQFTLSDWTVTNRMRYSNQSGSSTSFFPVAAFPAAGSTFGGPGAELRYATGPLAGQTIANPSGLNGNGLMTMSIYFNNEIRSLNNFTNDLRLSRVFSLSGGDLTTTAGLYFADQQLAYDEGFNTVLQDVLGGGRSNLLDVVTASGVPVTQGGVLIFGGSGGPGYHRSVDVRYRVAAPYASFNFHKGRLVLGGSMRYDTGRVRGNLRADATGDVRPQDMNQDGSTSTSLAEGAVSFTPLNRTQPVAYDYDYLSYSLGVTFRIAEPLAVFARYSRGARAGADRLLLSPAISAVDGSLLDRSAAYDPVRQAEMGVKYRKGGLTLNLTGFWAEANETNTQLNPDSAGTVRLELISRTYRAHGLEFEGGVRRGGFSLTAGATYTKAEIAAARNHPELIGKTPRHQADLIFQVTPQFETGPVTLGANIIGTTSSYAQDMNQLKMPGYATVNTFFQIRPIERLALSLSVNNLFDKRAIVDVNAASIPAGGLALAQTLYGRTISTSARFYF